MLLMNQRARSRDLQMRSSPGSWWCPLAREWRSIEACDGIVLRGRSAEAVASYHLAEARIPETTEQCLIFISQNKRKFTRTFYSYNQHLSRILIEVKWLLMLNLKPNDFSFWALTIFLLRKFYKFFTYCFKRSNRIHNNPLIFMYKYTE